MNQNLILNRLEKLGIDYEDLYPVLVLDPHYSLAIKNDQLGLANTKDKHFVSVDLFSKQLQYRSNSHLFAELVVKAVLGRNKKPLKILDCTTGFGKDSYLMALTGSKIHAYESNILMYALLKDGLDRASSIPEINNIELSHGDSIKIINDCDCDVIYIDPMYPATKKSAKNNKQMSFLQSFVGHQDEMAEKLLDESLNSQAKKVVIKRPPKSQFVNNIKPSSQILGKAARFDVYAINS